MRTLALVALLAVGNAHAGLTLTFERTRQGKATQTVVQLEGTKLRTNSTTEVGETIVIWDGDAKALTSVKPADKTYTRMDEASLTAMKEQLAAMKTQMEAQMAKMSPQQREQMEQMMKGRGAPAAGPRPEVKVTPLNKKLKVGQFDCELFERYWGEHKTEVCVTPWDKLPVTRDDFKPFQSMAEFFKAMFEGLPGATSTPEVQNDVMGELDRYKGFPVQTTSTDPMGGTSTFTFKSAVRGSIDQGVFAVPAGFTEKKQGPGKRKGPP